METKIIGEKIAKARKEKNLSQAQLAEFLFISPQAVGKWERGESVPDIITIIRLSEILGLALNYFSSTGNSEESTTDSNSNVVSSGVGSSANKSKLLWDMSQGNWANADFSGLQNLHDKFSSSNMQNCKFIGSDLSGIVLKNNNIDNCDFSNSDFSNSQIQKSYIHKNNFKNCSLKEAVYNESYITGCDFTNADFTKTIIQSGGIENSIFSNTALVYTSFKAIHISNIQFNGSILNCSFDNCKFTNVTFQNAVFTNTFFKCKTLKRIRFVDCKADRMSYEFLKNGKADMNGITLLTTSC